MQVSAWYTKTLRETKKETLVWAALSLIFVLALLFWNFVLGKPFEWKSIAPISEPSIFFRIVYSALVFVTLGRALYKMRFYQSLYDLMVRSLGDRRLYNNTKNLIWICMMFAMFSWIVPFVVHILNTGASIGYNVLAFILYLLPSVGITAILAVLYYCARYIVKIRPVA